MLDVAGVEEPILDGSAEGVDGADQNHTVHGGAEAVAADVFEVASFEGAVAGLESGSLDGGSGGGELRAEGEDADGEGFEELHDG